MYIQYIYISVYVAYMTFFMKSPKRTFEHHTAALSVTHQHISRTKHRFPQRRCQCVKQINNHLNYKLTTRSITQELILSTAPLSWCSSAPLINLSLQYV